MKTAYLLLLIIAYFALFSCGNAEEEPFGEVKKLSEFKETEFIPTLENKISAEKNAIYCATLLYAWQEIKDIIGQPLKINKSLTDLTLLNNSESHHNVLQADEYSVNTEVSGSMIKVKTEFSKSLPFEIKLTSFKNKLNFKGTEVDVFGTLGYDKEKTKIIKIAYYKNDNDFIIRLLPKNKEHEIILYKSKKKYNTLSKMLSSLKKKISTGRKKQNNKRLSWKYEIADEDEIVIPKLNFNIETNYLT